MGRKRYRDQILCRILEVCAENGASKTQIVYKCNLNFHTVMPYLELITRNGLAVRKMGGPIIYYETTPKGLEALIHMRALEEMMPEERNHGRWGVIISQ
jgi:predicted transcriptional regulator